MTYSEQKVKMGRQSVSILEITMKRCSLTFGQGACSAVEDVPGSGTKCFNTFFTCPVVNDYDQEDIVYRFSTQRIDSLQEAGGPPVFPTIMGIDNAPGQFLPQRRFDSWQ